MAQPEQGDLALHKAGAVHGRKERASLMSCRPTSYFPRLGKRSRIKEKWKERTQRLVGVMKGVGEHLCHLLGKR